MLLLNLLPKKIEEARSKRRMKAVLVLIVLIVVGGLTGTILRQRVVLASIQAEGKKYADLLGSKDMLSANDKVNKLKSQKAARDDRMAVVKKILFNQSEWLAVLDMLPGVIPENLWISSLSCSKKGDEMRISINGVALSEDEVFMMHERLRLIEWFTVVRLVSLGVVATTDAGYQAIRFNIALTGQPELKEVKDRIEKLYPTPKG